MLLNPREVVACWSIGKLHAFTFPAHPVGDLLRNRSIALGTSAAQTTTAAPRNIPLLRIRRELRVVLWDLARIPVNG